MERNTLGPCWIATVTTSAVLKLAQHNSFFWLSLPQRDIEQLPFNKYNLQHCLVHQHITFFVWLGYSLICPFMSQSQLHKIFTFYDTYSTAQK